MRPAFFALVALGCLSRPILAADPPKLELKDGDRIVYLGNTFVERDQAYGYLETLLTIRHPNIQFTFRNLGWSGDTVWGDARARFGARADGFKHLKEDVAALKPTVILLGYGMNESFAGEAGLEEFAIGLNTLLDTLEETKAKIVLISPTPHEKLGPPLPDPGRHEAALRLYSHRIEEIAKRRDLQFIDLFNTLNDAAGEGPLTDDGLHLTARGSWFVDELLARALGGSFRTRKVQFDKDGRPASSTGWTVEGVTRDDKTLRFEAKAETIADPVKPQGIGRGSAHNGGFVVGLEGIKPGRYVMKIDGEVQKSFEVTTGKCEVAIETSKEQEQVEKLRSAINKKNELHFNRWRPENETYLFLFRKHEQGNNAVEIPQFDPLIAELEAEINRLKKPAKHAYEIVREETKK